ncbi:helix-turn-helix domain-containing protein [Virgibacillus oceani]
MKQNKVAADLGITTYQLSIYENGKTKPDPGLISDIADYYNVRVDYLFGKTDSTYEENEFDPLAEIKKIVEGYGIQDIFFHNIEDWENLHDEDIRELRSHFEYIAHKAKQRKEQQD